jgi:hypothetical protein
LLLCLQSKQGTGCQHQLAVVHVHRPWAARCDEAGQPPTDIERMEDDVVVPIGSVAEA